MKRRLLRLWGALPLPHWLRWAMVMAVVPKFPAGVVGVVLDEAGKLLFFRHTYRGSYPWGLPSGWLEAGEDPAAAIAREIAEETGLQVTDVRPLLVRSAVDVRRIDLVFRCRLAGGEFRPSAEVSALAWFGRDELPAMMESQYGMMAEIFTALDEELHVQF